MKYERWQMKMTDEYNKWRWQERWHGIDERYTWKMKPEGRGKTCRKTWHIPWRRYFKYNYYKYIRLPYVDNM